jgi:hypothetical protein
VSVSTLADGIHLTVDTGDGTYDKVTLGSSSGFVADQATIITGAGHDLVTTRGTLDGDTLALVDFGDGSGDGSNQLDVDLHSVVTLAQASGTASHVVVVEDVNVTGEGSNKLAILNVADPSTIDDLQVNNYGEANVLDDADGTTIDTFGVGAVVGPLESSASIQGETDIGTFTIEGEVEFLSTSAPSTVTQFQVLATAVTGSTGIVNINAGADVTAKTSSRIGSLNFFGTGGKLTLQPRASSPSSSGARLLQVASLFMGSTPTSPDGVLDLKDNAMIVDYTSSSPLSTIQSLITSAYHASGTFWTGNGLGSSTAASVAADSGNSHKTGLGYGEATDKFSSFPATFEGQTVDNTTLLVKYTYYGDTDLSGFVSLADFNIFTAQFGQSPRRWTQGDFDYNYSIGLADFNRLASNFGQGGLGPGED